MRKSKIIAIGIVLFLLITLYWTACSLYRKIPLDVGCSATLEDIVISHHVQQEELAYPLAFSLVVYTDEDRAIRLLRAIYRPHNFYCIHVDRKSPPHVMYKIRQAAGCMQTSDNIVFVDDTNRQTVHWGRISVLDADLACARLLFTRDSRWKYWINLTGQEYPLRTNWELVKLLKALNGSNLVQAVFERRDIRRFPPRNYLPFNVTWYKGSVHVVVRYEFVDYMLNNSKAKLLYVALKRYEMNKRRAIFSDETFFATLNHNPDVFPIPGAFTGEHEQHVAFNLARAKVWIDDWLPCGSGYWRREICIFGLKDTLFLKHQPHLFANKFLPTVEPRAYDLLEMWYAVKTQIEYATGQVSKDFNMSYYSSLPFAKQHL